MNIELIIALIVILVITIIFAKKNNQLIDDRDRALEKCLDAQEDATRAEARRYEEWRERGKMEHEMRAKLDEAEEQIAVFQKIAEETEAELQKTREELKQAYIRIEDLKISRQRCYWAKPNSRK